MHYKFTQSYVLDCLIGWNGLDGMSFVGYKSSKSTLSNNAREIFAFQMGFVLIIHTKCDDANTRSLLHSGALILNIYGTDFFHIASFHR